MAACGLLSCEADALASLHSVRHRGFDLRRVLRSTPDSVNFKFRDLCKAVRYIFSEAVPVNFESIGLERQGACSVLFL